jgi:hypothetical protein
MGHFDNESRAFVDQVYQRADAFLFGQWTYEIFAPTGARWIRAAVPSQTP